MNTLGMALQSIGGIFFVALGFLALDLSYKHSKEIGLRFFGFGAGMGIIISAVGLLVASGVSIGPLILLGLGVLLLGVSIPKRVFHPLHKRHS